MAEVVKDFWAGMPWGMYIVLLIAIILVIASWAVPPVGMITKSALQGAALILAGGWAYYTICNLPEIISSGAKIRASYGGATIEIGRHKKGEKTEDENNEQNIVEKEDEKWT